ncbi:MAG: hypothetical protein AAFZ52_00330 [Bacteroidota bacterium]
MSIVACIAYVSAFLLLLLISATARRRKPTAPTRVTAKRKSGFLAFLLVAAFFLAIASFVKQEVTATVAVEGEPTLTLSYVNP